MLVSFKVENFRSIKDLVEVDFKATNKLKEEHLVNNTFVKENEELLNSVILYGRNASGKSNILNALNALGYLISNSDKFKHDDGIDCYEPFKFNKQTNNSPIKFDITFFGVDSKNKFQYVVHYDEKKIIKESLAIYPNGVKAFLYRRVESKITYGDYYKGTKKSIENDLLENQLFLSKSATSKVLYLNEAYNLLNKHMLVSVIHDTEYDKSVIRAFSELMLDDDRLKANVLKLLQAGDTNILDFSIRKNEMTNFKFPKNIPEEVQEKFMERFKYEVNTSHLMFNDDELIGEEELRMDEESFGTKKLLAIGSLIVDTLTDGGVLVIDELDKGLHPLLTKMLIKLFHSKSNNPKNAQLVFATHDSTLLDNDVFRRDQICFVDKEYAGGSIFYKLSDIKGVRKDIPIDKWYLSGRFKATPVISEVNLEF